MERNTEESVAAVRRFNRFYTRRIRIIQDKLSSTDYSLAEANAMFELCHRSRPTASDLVDALSLDQGYVSRLLRSLEQRGLVARTRSETDRRATLLSLTDAGRAEVATIDRLACEEVRQLLAPLSQAERARLLGAMAAIESLLGTGKPRDRFVVLREHLPGDIGWVTERNALYYAQNFDFEPEFEALIAETTARFLRDFRPGRERCWIAELDGERVGAVFVVQEAAAVARLRLLLVEPKAQGFGLGRQLVSECVRFSRQAGYDKLVLWTRNVLAAARHLYAEAGFQLVAETPHETLAPVIVEETWELVL